jgi:hypothetical protein
MGNFAVIVIIICSFLFFTGYAQSMPAAGLTDGPIDSSLRSDNQSLIPVLILPFIKCQNQGTVYEITSLSDSIRYTHGRYNPLVNRSSCSPIEQQVLDIAIKNLTEGGISQDTIILYKTNLNQRYSKDEGNNIETNEVSLVRVIQGIPSEEEAVGYFFILDPQHTIIKKEYTNVSLIPFETVMLESPYEVLKYQLPEMTADPFTSDKAPIIVTNVSLGYSFYTRPYFRGDYYEPVWVYRGLNKQWKEITFMTWASKERGMYPPPPDDLDTALVSSIIIHNTTKTNLILHPGDPGFDVIETEAKQVLHTLFGECLCFISAEKTVDQRENGSYVEVVFRDGANTVIPLFEDIGPFGKIGRRLDGAIIAFQGPYGRQVYALYLGEECDNCTIWAFHATKRDTTTLERIASDIAG